MRVIGNIPHSTLKITVFETDTRFPVQFEAGAVAQIFRFRKGGQIENLSDVKALVDETMCKGVIEGLKRQNELMIRSQARQAKEESDDFPAII